MLLKSDAKDALKALSPEQAAGRQVVMLCCSKVAALFLQLALDW